MSTFQHLLVPTDYSQNAAAALDVAVRLASDLGARIRVLHVCTSNPLRSAVREGFLSSSDSDETVRRKLESHHEALCQQFLAPLGDGANAIERVLLFGDPAQQINTYARAHQIDLIVIGRRGATFADVMLGSVAERVIRHAACPVVVVRRQDEIR